MKKIANLILILLFFIPINIYGNDLYKLYYVDEADEITFENYIFLEDFTQEEVLFSLIKKIFNQEFENIKGIFLENGNLYINFNQKTYNMPKGSFGELAIVRSTLHTVFQFEKIKTVTFLQEGNFFIMDAGSFIYKYTREMLEWIEENQ